MIEEKQIEEMVRIMNETCNVYDKQGNHIRNKCYECEYWSEDNYCCCSYNGKEAEALYNAGYRKASEVAREIFAEIEAIKCVGLLPSSWVKQFAELKKKYESEKDNV